MPNAQVVGDPDAAGRAKADGEGDAAKDGWKRVREWLETTGVA